MRRQQTHCPRCGEELWKDSVTIDLDGNIRLSLYPCSCKEKASMHMLGMEMPEMEIEAEQQFI